jgi:hypothetical protein
MFLNLLISTVYANNHGIWPQMFAAGVTQLWPPGEIRRFDVTDLVFQNKIQILI